MGKPEVKRDYTLGERLYLVEIVKGLGITWKHFMKNFRASLQKGPHTVPTCWQYPWDKREISPIFRGEHMLLLDEEGREKCVACGMCQRVCPAKCITIKRGKVKEGEEAKYAGKTYCASFEIDLLRCIFCGLCEEACNKGAIVLGQGYELADFSRQACVADKKRLIGNFLRAKEEGRLKPKRPPVPVAGAKDAKAAGPQKAKSAGGGQGKGLKRGV